MARRYLELVLLLILLNPAGFGVSAGVHYSAEEIAALPAQWRGFLLDQRKIRGIALPATPGQPASPLRLRYQQAARELETTARTRPLTAQEATDLGAIHLRLGDSGQALKVLRTAQRQHPREYRLFANLGTAWQMQGDLVQAEAMLREAVRLAPPRLKRAEELHWRLVRERIRDPRGEQLDDLLGVRFVNARGEYEPGQLREAEREKLSGDVVADVQLLALWLPADGRVLWLLAELAAAYGDFRTSAAMFDGCVTEFAMRSPELRQRRQRMREAVTRLAQATPTTRQEHEGHAGTLQTRSARPLVDRQTLSDLPPIRAEGVNTMPWTLLAQTSIDRQFRPTFPRYLKDLEDKQVTLTGFVQPLGTDLKLGVFLLMEYPVGCWYCEVPDVVGLVLVELPPGQHFRFTRDLVQVRGRLKLNRSDPEDFLYSIKNATVKSIE